MRVLISAYACEPGKGSEPEVGWKWATHMARLHEVTVMTRANNRANIERGLKELDGPVPTFFYHELPKSWVSLKKRGLPLSVFYWQWQRSLSSVIAEHSSAFDLIHHLTFAGFRHPCAILGHHRPTVWGPVGGIESMPQAFLRDTRWRDAVEERARNLANVCARFPMGSAAGRARRATIAVGSTPEICDFLRGTDAETRMQPAIGIEASEIATKGRRIEGQPLRLLFAGQLRFWKGISLAIRAVARARSRVLLSIVGAGDYEARARGLVAQCGVADRVRFEGRVERAAMRAFYREADIFLYPSFHDSGAFVVIEAMSQGLPVICLDRGGPGLAVDEGCGVKVATTSLLEVEKDLAEAIDAYSARPERFARHSDGALRRIRDGYVWNEKAIAMSELYSEALTIGC